MSNKSEDKDNCAICLCVITEDKVTDNCKKCYYLPECNHPFHTECIIHWFRQGRKSCPICNNNGAVAESENTRSSYNYSIYGRARDISYALRFAKTDKAPPELKKIVEKYKKLSEKLKDKKCNLKEAQEEVGIFKEIKKKVSRLRRAVWKCNSDIRTTRIQIESLFPVEKVIIVSRKIV